MFKTQGNKRQRVIASAARSEGSFSASASLPVSFLSSSSALNFTAQPQEFDFQKVNHELHQCFEEVETTLENLLAFFRRWNVQSSPESLLLKKEVVISTQLDIYWLLHTAGILSFKSYLEVVEEAVVIAFLRTNLLFLAQANNTEAYDNDDDADDDADFFLSATSADVIQFLFDEKNASDDGSSTFLLFSRLLDDVLIPRKDKNPASMFICLEDNDLLVFSEVIKHVSVSFHSEHVRAWQGFQLTRLLSCVLVVSSENKEKHSTALDCLLPHLHPTAISHAIERVLRCSEQSPLDFSTNKILRASTSPSMQSILELILQASFQAFPGDDEEAIKIFRKWMLQPSLDILGASVISKTIGMPSAAEIMAVALSTAVVGIAEGSTSLWARSVCLVDLLHCVVRYSKSLLLPIFPQWLDFAFGPKPGAMPVLSTSSASSSSSSSSSFSSTSAALLLDQDHSVTSLVVGAKNLNDTHTAASSFSMVPAVASSKEMGFAALALCDFISFQSEQCLQALCYAIRNRRDLNKEACDLFVQSARAKLREMEQSMSILMIEGDDEYNNGARIAEINAQRVNKWYEVYSKTKQLPVGFSSLFSMQGKNFYKKVLREMNLMLLDVPNNKELRTHCEELLSALSGSHPNLCSVEAAKAFSAGSGSKEGLAGALLENVDVPHVCRKPLIEAIAALKFASETVKQGKLLSNSKGINHKMGDLEIVASWKISCKSALHFALEGKVSSSSFSSSSSSSSLRHVSLFISALLHQVLKDICARISRINIAPPVDGVLIEDFIGHWVAFAGEVNSILLGNDNLTFYMCETAMPAKWNVDGQCGKSGKYSSSSLSSSSSSRMNVSSGGLLLASVDDKVCVFSIYLLFNKKLKN